MQACRFRGTELVLGDVKKPQPGPRDVLVRVKAASLNYRDLLIQSAATQGGLEGRVPLSDGAGIIEEIGAEVSRWRVGDRVAGLFFRDWMTCPFKAGYMPSALGGSTTGGVLAEFVVLPEHAVVAVPSHLSSIEAATLPCAGVTAWHGLVARGGLAANDTLLVQGTGGVALFGLQFASALGARTIVVSSSDGKLARARKLGAAILINYRARPDWDAAVMEQTGGEGATHILELGGPDTYDRSVNTVAACGKIIQIGVLTDFGPKPDLARLQTQNADIHGVTVGSGAHFQDMNAFIAEKRFRPIIDQVFTLRDAAKAYEHLCSGQHFGKVVIRL
jgi:NADPH:quinone reductase-like Zn-dependent oxidoreductase